MEASQNMVLAFFEHEKLDMVSYVLYTKASDLYSKMIEEKLTYGSLIKVFDIKEGSPSPIHWFESKQPIRGLVYIRGCILDTNRYKDRPFRELITKVMLEDYREYSSYEDGTYHDYINRLSGLADHKEEGSDSADERSRSSSPIQRHSVTSRPIRKGK